VRQAQGYTLLELMVVLVVIGIMTALIVPELRGAYRSAVLESSAREVLWALRLAHSQAVTTGRSVRFRWDARAHRYLLEVEPPESSSRAPKDAPVAFLPLENVPGAAGRLDPEVSIEVRSVMEDDARVGPAGVEFHADGTADAAELHLTGAGGAHVTLAVTPSTARVAERRGAK